MAPDDILIAIFSYNRSRELDICLRSLRANTDCRGIVFDDGSDDPAVLPTIDSHGIELVKGSGGTGKRGGFYRNMNAALQTAAAEGYSYLMTVQDDMQFVRPFDAPVRTEYASIFGGEPRVTQIDYRFVRKTSANSVRRHPALPAFEWTNEYYKSYSDVGLFSVERLNALGFTFAEGKMNRSRATDIGMLRVYPFTPIAMHVPFPSAFRNRAPLITRLFISHGAYRYEQMTSEDCNRMDGRPPRTPPFYRKHLKVLGLSPLARLRFLMMKGGRVFR